MGPPQKQNPKRVFFYPPLTQFGSPKTPLRQPGECKPHKNPIYNQGKALGGIPKSVGDIWGHFETFWGGGSHTNSCHQPPPPLALGRAQNEEFWVFLTQKKGTKVFGGVGGGFFGVSPLKMSLFWGAGCGVSPGVCRSRSPSV